MNKRNLHLLIRIRATACLLILLVITGTGLHAEEFNKTGTTGFVFLNLPVTARYTAMGETGISNLNGNADGIFVNPALIAHIPQTNAFSATYGKWYLGTDHHATAYVRKIKGFGSVGLFMNLFSFGEMERTRYFAPEELDAFTGDENNIYLSTGTFQAGAYAIGISYGRQMTDRFTFGMDLKYVREYIAEYHARNILVDMGFFYRTQFSSLRIGAFLKNFGLETQYVNEKFKMPQQMTLGISFEPYGSLEDPSYVTVNIEAVHPNDMSEHVNLGIESK
ncbi:MAG: PorV/PorQ family protein [Candidatus Marinimicrobia bacterium]|nr:PorV/PorQ family protein [Candidatus Neomarinimicrobiota bacterium]